MKKNFMKTAVAAVCVVAAGMGGFKAYNVSNQAKADMLLSGNVKALSMDWTGPDCPQKNGVCKWMSMFGLESAEFHKYDPQS